MACFIVPMVQAIATSAYCRIGSKSIASPDASPLHRNLPALEKMLWGGTIMLIVDHIISGELTWRFPFFTALNAEGGLHVMWQEMLTVGVPIALAATLVWVVYAVAKDARNRKVTKANIQ